MLCGGVLALAPLGDARAYDDYMASSQNLPDKAR